MIERDLPTNGSRINGEDRRLEDRLYPGDTCLLYTSDASDERSSVDLGGRRIIQKNTTPQQRILHKHPNNLNQ